jgi:hypothetical protein
MIVQSTSTLSSVTPYLLTLMATICSALSMVMVGKSEDLEL